MKTGGRASYFTNKFQVDGRVPAFSQNLALVHI